MTPPKPFTPDTLPYEIWSNDTVAFPERDYIPMCDGYRLGAKMIKSWEGDALLEVPKITDNVLEDIFCMFNRDDRPNGKVAHSLSVGDVVVLDGIAFAVESFGFKELSGNPTAFGVVDFNPNAPSPANWHTFAEYRKLDPIKKKEK